MLLCSAARVGVRPTRAQRWAVVGRLERLGAGLHDPAISLGGDDVKHTVMLMWACRRLGIPLPAATVGVLLQPEGPFGPARLPACVLFNALEVLLECRVRPTKAWLHVLCRQLARWLASFEGRAGQQQQQLPPIGLLFLSARALRSFGLHPKLASSRTEVPALNLVWRLLATAVRRHLAAQGVLLPRKPTAAAPASHAQDADHGAPPTPAPTGAAGEVEQLRALQAARALGLLAPQQWDGAVALCLQQLLAGLAPGQYGAWLGLVARLAPRHASRRALEELMFSWYLVASGPRLQALPPHLLHAALRATARTAAALQMPVDAAWLSDALRLYTERMPLLAPAELAQAPQVLLLLRRVPPLRWQLHYASLVHAGGRLAGMSPRTAAAMVEAAEQLSPQFGWMVRTGRTGG